MQAFKTEDTNASDPKTTVSRNNMEIIKKTRLFYLIFVICSYTVGKRMYANFLDGENTKLFYKTSRNKEVKFNLQQTIAVLTLQ